MKIKISSKLDIGKIRDNNEDALAYCADLSQPEWRDGDISTYMSLGENGAFAVIADGMGGPSAGEIASSMAVQAVQNMMTAERIAAAISGGEATIKSLMGEAINQADSDIQQRLATDSETQGMGTTIVMCWLFNEKVYVAWCGDSRCYSYHPAQGLRLLTHDHSLVQEMVDKGEITREDAFTHPDGNVITRGLGDFDCDVEPDFCVHTIKSNETLMLCSDGLCGYCRDREMETCMDLYYTDVTKCSQELLQLPLDEGGYDNISIILISIIPDNQDAPASRSLFQSIKRAFRHLINSSF